MLKPFMLVGLLALTTASTSFDEWRHANLRQDASRGVVQADVKWERYTARDEEFSVKFPVLPVVTTTEPYILKLDETRREQTFAAYADGVVYVVVSYENPKRRQSLDEIVDEYIGGRMPKGGTDFKGEIKLNGFPGKQYSLDTKTLSYSGAVQFYITNKHVYVVRVAYRTAEEEASRSATQQFLKSFMLGSKLTGKEIESERDALSKNVPLTASATTTATAANGNSEQTKPSPSPSPVPSPSSAKDVTSKAVIITKPEARYTEEARQNEVTGVVVLRAVLSSTGQVTGIRTVSGLPNGLTEKAIFAAHQIFFLPAIKDGKRVSQYIQIEYNFNLY
jgi:TonB family protein